ncbi:hypothetical protein GCK72_024349 [Caenorhabditis remanei]|nr:hypothetical protein GCK72_024349 [Caenorhabditis remanei]KAF1747883.1 hypothetical protein GCK72_024349 [Caenorhabditis remanei]
MSQENKSNSLKRSYPEENDEPHQQETSGTLTNVASILRSQEQQNAEAVFAQPLPPIKGFIPPPNTPCSED